MKRKQIDKYSYNEDDILGEGQFGFVYKGKDTVNKTVLAIKVIPMHILQRTYFQTLFLNEVSALMRLDSPYIVRYIDLKMTQNNTYLITEFCDGGDLSSVLQERKRLDEPEVLDILWQTTEAFKVMKEYNMLHRDLKPANMLLHQGTLKIADLGFSKTVEDFQLSINNSTVGSPIYMSPQVLFKHEYTSKCDVWSLGIVIYQLLVGEVPWHALDMLELSNKIKTQPLTFPPNIPISAALKDFIMGTLRYEEADRLSWDEVFQHPALKMSKLGQEMERKGNPHLNNGKKDQKPKGNLPPQLQPPPQSVPQPPVAGEKKTPSRPEKEIISADIAPPKNFEIAVFENQYEEQQNPAKAAMEQKPPQHLPPPSQPQTQAQRGQLTLQHQDSIPLPPSPRQADHGDDSAKILYMNHEITSPSTFQKAAHGVLAPGQQPQNDYYNTAATSYNDPNVPPQYGSDMAPNYGDTHGPGAGYSIPYSTSQRGNSTMTSVESPLPENKMGYGGGTPPTTYPGPGNQSKNLLQPPGPASMMSGKPQGGPGGPGGMYPGSQMQGQMPGQFQSQPPMQQPQPPRLGQQNSLPVGGPSQFNQPQPQFNSAQNMGPEQPRQFQAPGSINTPKILQKAGTTIEGDRGNSPGRRIGGQGATAIVNRTNGQNATNNATNPPNQGRILSPPSQVPPMPGQRQNVRSPPQPGQGTMMGQQPPLPQMPGQQQQMPTQQQQMPGQQQMPPQQQSMPPMPGQQQQPTGPGPMTTSPMMNPGAGPRQPQQYTPPYMPGQQQQQVNPSPPMKGLTGPGGMQQGPNQQMQGPPQPHQQMIGGQQGMKPTGPGQLQPPQQPQSAPVGGVGGAGGFRGSQFAQPAPSQNINSWTSTQQQPPQMPQNTGIRVGAPMNVTQNTFGRR